MRSWGTAVLEIREEGRNGRADEEVWTSGSQMKHSQKEGLINWVSMPGNWEGWERRKGKKNL